jgi:uncharacterized protein (DUF302 family)
MTRQTVNFARAVSVFFLGVLQSACAQREPASDDLYRAVDELYDAVVAATDRFDVIAEIDHSRLAALQGETMPPARVVMFSDPTVNTSILQQEPQAGLDLPFRVLAYAQGRKPAVIPTTAKYLQRRHGLADGPALQQYEESIPSVVGAVPRDAVVEFDVSSLGKGQGIVTLTSDYGFEETIERLKAAIMAEDDTIWFGDIDYRDQAAALGVELPALTLLLFGAPGPGGKAMAERPRMGLDAFCQKVLVHQTPSGQVEVPFNEMPWLSKLHYGDSALPHMVITKRMRDTLGAAVEK